MIKKKMIKSCLLKLLLCLLPVLTWRSSHRLMAIPNNSHGRKEYYHNSPKYYKVGVNSGERAGKYPVNP